MMYFAAAAIFAFIIVMRVVLNLSRRIDILEERLLDVEDHMSNGGKQHHSEARAAAELFDRLSSYQTMKFSQFNNDRK